MKFYGITANDQFDPSNADYFSQLEQIVLINNISGLYLNPFGMTFPSSYIIDANVTNIGSRGFVDDANSTADSFSQILKGRIIPTGTTATIQTNTLYSNTTSIERLVVQNVTNFDPDTNTTVDVSFDDGSTWSTAHELGLILSFAGTTDDSGTYKLKLKFNLENSLRTWTITTQSNYLRYDSAGIGTYSDGLIFGGYNTDANIGRTSTEIWNGVSWSLTGGLPTPLTLLSGCGTGTNALSVGGYHNGTTHDYTNIWNGLAWATTTALQAVRYGSAACGNIADALVFGGNTGSSSSLTTTEQWGGSAWATTTAMAEARAYHGGCGNTGSALAFGGYSWSGSGATLSTTEKWTLTSWATTPALNSVRRNLAGCGTAALALAIGGYSDATIYQSTELWNGSIWATTSNLIFGISDHAGFGTSTNAMITAGYVGGGTNASQIFTGVLQYGFGVKIN